MSQNRANEILSILRGTRFRWGAEPGESVSIVRVGDGYLVCIYSDELGVIRLGCERDWEMFQRQFAG